MSGIGILPDSLLRIAKRTLALQSHASADAVPSAYLAELDKHIGLYPHDTNFSVITQPGKGFGVVRCLEDGCNYAIIQLTKLVGSSDGGMKDGLGSLSAYRNHIVEHPTHMDKRHRRVKASEVSKKAGLNNSSSLPSAKSSNATKAKRAGLLGALDANFDSSAPTGTPSPSTSYGMSRSAQSEVGSLGQSPPSPPRSDTVKASSIPRKRMSDSAHNWTGQEMDEESDPDIRSIRQMFVRKPVPTIESPKTLSSKRAKLEDVKTPPIDPNDSQAKGIPSSARKLTVSSAEKAAAKARIKAKDDEQKARMKKMPTKKMPQSILGLKRTNPKAELYSVAKMKAEREQLEKEYESIINDTSGRASSSGGDNEMKSLINAQSDATNTFSQRPNIQTSSQVNVQTLRPSLHLGPSGTMKGIEASEQSGSNIRPSPPVNLDTDDDSVSELLYRFNRANAFPTSLSDDERFDYDGNYYGRGRDNFAGPVAQAGDLDKFFLDAGNAEQFDSNASVHKALEKLGIPDLNTPLPGMEITLMPHQAIGVAWMLDKEKGSNNGGCLCDEMGLGKTVQMIATMVFNRSDDPAVKTNLIVAPLALLDQWKLEIELKTNDGLKAFVYHGPKKPKTKKELAKYDVILTTFSTLMLEWPDEEAKEKKKKKKKQRRKSSDDFITDDDEFEKKLKEKPGILVTMNWYRVILDEAQNIRNKMTRISRAVTRLHSKYRWCLTGTPITNGLGDAYPLLRFLQIRPWHDWTDFNGHIMRLEKRNPSLATVRLQAIFASCLLRRKKDSRLDGKRLIDLPSKEVVLCKLDFTKDEMEIYKMVETRSQIIFNRYLQAGTVLKNYAQVLVLLLRLRQICSHTSLITEEEGIISDDDLNDTKPEARDELIRAQTCVSREFVVNVKAMLRGKALQRMAAEKESADAVVEEDDCPVCYDNFTDAVITPCNHAFCRECIYNVLNSPHVNDAAEPNKYKMNERPCPSCRAAITRNKLFSRDAFEPTDEELLVNNGDKETNRPSPSAEKFEDSDEEMPDVKDVIKRGNALRKITGMSKAEGKAPAKKLSSRRKRTSRQILDTDEEQDEEDNGDDLSDFIVHSDEDEDEKDAKRSSQKRLGKRRASEVEIDDSDQEDQEEFDDVIYGPTARRKITPAQTSNIKVLSKFLPSTKMMHMMDTLLAWAKENPGEKTLIISQWTQCLSLVSDYLNTKEFYHVKYQGDMNREKRVSAVHAFMKNDKVQVMLMSLKCGGVGLNLTRANRVISLDLGWSEAVENQAFDRVHRLGQTKPVVVQRLVINNTVEDRVLAMQEKKKNLADGSLGEGTGKKIGRLSVRELANLFGLDHRGRVLANY